MNNNLSQQPVSGEKFDLKKTISLYTRKWVWFLVSILLCLAIAYTYLRYTVPQYLATSNVMIIGEGEESSANKVFKELSGSSESESASIEDEILVFKSRNVISNVVRNLNLNVQYFTQGLVLETEIYGNHPLEINFIDTDSTDNSSINLNFYIDIISNEKFKFRFRENDDAEEKRFGEAISTGFGEMVLNPKSNEKLKNLLNKSIRVRLTNTDYIVESLRNRISIYPSQNYSKILSINLQDPVVNKAKDVINTLISEYDKYTIETKNSKSKGIDSLIDYRINLTQRALLGVDDSIVDFKIANKVTDVSSQGGQFSSLSFQNEQDIQAIKTQLRLLANTKNLLSNNSNKYQTLPSNLGDASMSALASEYNLLLAQRESYLKTAGENNPMVVELDEKLTNIRNNLSQNIKAQSSILNIQLTSLENQYQSVSSKISSVPGQENKLRAIERGRGIKENLYLYLLQKKEEAIISQTVTSSNVKIIDTAYSIGLVSPNDRITYIAAIFLGLFIPFSIIYVRDLLDSKIHNKEDLESEVKNITVLGEIPKVKGNILVKRNDRSILSESFRIIRTNFDYIRRGRKVENYNNVVFVTSTINGEGKSFFSMNMALTLANTDKRVLLIGADIRNPKLLLGLDNQKKKDLVKVGLTEYLVNKSILIGEAINTYDISGNKIDVLLSGKVPPNPAELLMSDRMKPLFDKVSEQYDYVIVDTAPSMLVTDTLLFNQYAGHTIYMTRADYTEKRILNFAKELHTENKLNGMMLVVNDVKQSNFGYGAKYGYYGAKKKKSFFRKRA